MIYQCYIAALAHTVDEIGNDNPAVPMEDLVETEHHENRTRRRPLGKLLLKYLSDTVCLTEVLTSDVFEELFEQPESVEELVE